MLLYTVGLIAGVLFLAGLVGVLIRYAGLWLRAYVTQAGVSLPSLVFMSLRNVNPSNIVDTRVMAVQAGLQEPTARSLEAHYLAGGNIRLVTLALIAANRAGIELNWRTAAAIDLAGRNVLEAVLVSVNTQVIDCPEQSDGKRRTLDGVSRDGIQLKVRVCVTVRTNLSQLIGGATERTVIARVGQGIITAIGSCNNYQTALASPQLISRQVLSAGLDSQTAYALVSIDIADIDVGANIGARLQADQADADMRVARARAEQRRSMAIARQAEMLALYQENLAIAVLAEAAIPAGIAHAYRNGNLRAPVHNARSGRHRQSGTHLVRIGRR